MFSDTIWPKTRLYFYKLKLNIGGISIGIELLNIKIRPYLCLEFSGHDRPSKKCHELSQESVLNVTFNVGVTKMYNSRNKN